jgi:actin-related protein
MANNIILLGGTSKLHNLVEELEDRLINRISEFDPDIDRVEVLDLTLKEISSTDVSFVGATVYILNYI